MYRIVNVKDLDEMELYKLRISFNRSEDAERFAALVIDDLQVRIGERISMGLTDSQLEEFDRCDENEAGPWLEENEPDYRDRVERVLDEVETELFQYRYHIKNAEVQEELRECTCSVDELNMSKRTLKWVKSLEINTIGELAAADLAAVDDPSADNVKESIREILYSLDKYRWVKELQDIEEEFKES